MGSQLIELAVVGVALVVGYRIYVNSRVQQQANTGGPAYITDYYLYQTQPGAQGNVGIAPTLAAAGNGGL